jgi:predicted transcriptional regulator
MADALDIAIEKLRRVPKKRRKEAAAMIEEFVAEETASVYVLTAEEERLIDEGLAELDRGEFVTQTEFSAMIERRLKR